MLKKVKSKSYKNADVNNRAEYVCSVVSFLRDTLYQCVLLDPRGKIQ
jgi:hypothetical protein